MKKIINGEEVEVSLAEQKGLEAEWAVEDAAIASVAATQYQQDRATAYETEAAALFFLSGHGTLRLMRLKRGFQNDKRSIRSGTY